MAAVDIRFHSGMNRNSMERRKNILNVKAIFYQKLEIFYRRRAKNRDRRIKRKSVSVLVISKQNPNPRFTT